MKNLQTSIVVEETWVEKQTEKLQALPTATSARELDVSTLITRLFPPMLSGFHQLRISQLAMLSSAGSLVGPALRTIKFIAIDDDDRDDEEGNDILTGLPYSRVLI